MKVRKRDSSLERFSKTKIRKSLMKTFKTCKIKFCQECYDETIKNIVEQYNSIESDILDVETIQDITEETLYKCGMPDVAKTYILYRHDKDRIREFVKQKEKFIDEYKNSYNTADATVDDNSNVANKNIGVLNAEIHKNDNIQINRTAVTNKLHELYPDFDAKQYCRDLNDHIIYKNDESSFACISPYCVAITMYPFLLNGLKDLGGLSARPKNLDSYCGMLVNLIFALSCQFAGACMYKDQKIIAGHENNLRIYTAQQFVEQFELNKKFENYQGQWEYCDISDKDYYVTEYGKPVKVNRVFRRKYDDDIYKITTKSGLTSMVSKDHKFKTLYRERELPMEAYNLKEFDTVFCDKDMSYIIDKNSQDYKDGQFLGIICGDGNITSQYDLQIAVHDSQKYIYDFVFNYIKTIYGREGTYTHDDRKGNCCGTYRISDKNIVTDIKNKLIASERYDCYTKNIDVTDKSINFQLGFLDGLLVTDGHCDKTRGFVLSLCNENLIKTIVKILNNININNINANKFVSKKTNKSDVWSTHVPLRCLKYFDLAYKKTMTSNTDISHSISYIERETYYLGNTYGKSFTKNKYQLNCEVKTPKYSDNHTDTILSIETFKNDCEWVYEIETETHWYSCGGVITHNCAVPEALLCFDYFARKEWGDDYIDCLDENYKSDKCFINRTIRGQIHQYFQQIVYSINQPAAARGMQSAFVNFSYFDENFFHGMFDEFYFPDGTKPIWKTLKWLQQDFMMWFNEERLKSILTFPVESFALIQKDGEFLDKDNYKFVCDEYARGHSFFTYISDTVDSLSSCCRLKNKLNNVKEFSFTNGNLSVQSGSKSVISLNLSRIIQNATKDFDNPKDLLEKDSIYDAIKKYLTDVLERVYKYQNAYNELLWDMHDAKLLPAYDAGFIHLNKQYLTIGLNGLNQAAEYLGLKCTKNKRYGEFCHMIFGTIKEQNSLHKTNKTMFNTEQVPAESLAVKNYNWDKEDGYWVPEDTNLYASYIYKPNDPNVSVLDKITMHGNDYIGDYLDGGSAAHINLEEHLTPKQYDTLLKHAAKVGCQYLTFNVPNSECADCGWIGKTPVEVCPKCGSKHINYWDRIIGYLTKINNWSEGRRIEQKTRIYTKPEKIK